MTPKVTVYCEDDELGRVEWHYIITGYPPPHQRTTHSCGPFRTKRAAERDAKRNVSKFMAVILKPQLNPHDKSSLSSPLSAYRH